MCHETLFHLCVPVGQKIVRTVIVYGVIVIGLRLAGKRQLANFTAFDLVVLITISNAVQNAIIGPDNTVTGGLIGAATLLVLNNVVVRITYYVRGADALLEGRATVLFEDGRLNKKACRHELITQQELETAVRRQGARSLEEVERIVLEPSGNVSVVVKERVTMSQLLDEMREVRSMLAGRRSRP